MKETEYNQSLQSISTNLVKLQSSTCNLMSKYQHDRDDSFKIIDFGIQTPLSLEQGKVESKSNEISTIILTLSNRIDQIATLKISTKELIAKSKYQSVSIQTDPSEVPMAPEVIQTIANIGNNNHLNPSINNIDSYLLKENSINNSQNHPLTVYNVSQSIDYDCSYNDYQNSMISRFIEGNKPLNNNQNIPNKIEEINQSNIEIIQNLNESHNSNSMNKKTQTNNKIIKLKKMKTQTKKTLMIELNEKNKLIDNKLKLLINNNNKKIINEKENQNNSNILNLNSPLKSMTRMKMKSKLLLENNQKFL